MTSTTAKQPSTTAETAKRLKTLLKPLKDERKDATRIDEVRRLFSQQDMSIGGTEAVQKWKAFLSTHLDIFCTQLMERMERKNAVRTFWGLIAVCPSYTLQNHPFLSQTLLKKWLQSMPSRMDQDKSLRTMVESEFLHQFVDVQYYAYIALAQLADEQYNRDASDTKAAELLFQLLTMLPRVKTQEDLDGGTYLFSPPATGKPEEEDDQEEDDDDEQLDSDDDDEEDSEESDDEEEKKPVKRQRKEVKVVRVFQYQQLKAHRKVMVRAWLAILKLRLPAQCLKHALQTLPTQILPFVASPLRFADFFVQAYGDQQGGVIPVLALDGLFLLMMNHGLEYPLFYASLYRLIQPSLFYVKYRIRFFELLIKCLERNVMLPAHVVAAFCKRLLRASLHAPPSGCLFALALCSNLMRKHPECACLIHRDGDEMEDKFNAETNDPTKAHALESSMWELEVLRKHYFPAVSTMAMSIGQEEGPLHDMTDFLSHTYKSLFDQERKRLDKKRKKVPLAFHKPKTLFVENDVFGGILKIQSISTKD